MYKNQFPGLIYIHKEKAGAVVRSPLHKTMHYPISYIQLVQTVRPLFPKSTRYGHFVALSLCQLVKSFCLQTVRNESGEQPGLARHTLHRQ